MRELILLVFVGFMIAALLGPLSAAISDSGNTQISTSVPSTFAIDTTPSITLAVHTGGNWQPGQSFEGNQLITVSANNQWQLTVYDSSSWNGILFFCEYACTSLNPTPQPDSSLKG